MKIKQIFGGVSAAQRLTGTPLLRSRWCTYSDETIGLDQPSAAKYIERFLINRNFVD